MHDLRFFLENGLELEKIDPLKPSYVSPRNLESALSLTFNVLVHSHNEIESSQTLDYLNIFLAPFARDTEPSRIKDALRLFIANLTQHTRVSLGLELSVPDFLGEKPAVGKEGKRVGTYADYTEQAQLFASLLLEVFTEESTLKPLTNPSLILKIRPRTFADERARALLVKAHNFASEKGTPYFARLGQKDEHSVFSSSGLRLNSDFDGDWEIDTLRTGCLGIVTINMPRIVYESEKDKTKFLDILQERIEMASRTLEIKQQSLKRHGKNLLPFIMQSGNGDQYFRLEDCSRIINLAGLNEATFALCEKTVGDEKTLALAAEITKNASAYVQKIGKRRRVRLSLATLPSPQTSERLARVDIERYGVAKVKFSGTREQPFYSTVSRMTLMGGRIPEELLNIESKFEEAHVGGSTMAIELGEKKYGPDDLLTVTKQLAESQNTCFFAFDRKVTYCSSCRKNWFGLMHKCPSCGAVGTLVFFDRFSGA
jgi:ribonucleoside-triphosphate reductase